MRIKFIEPTFVRGGAVDVGDVRDEDTPLAQLLIGSRRAVAFIEDAPVGAPAAPEQAALEQGAPEQAAITGTETATAPEATAKPRRRG